MKDCKKCGGGLFKDFDPYCDHTEPAKEPYTTITLFVGDPPHLVTMDLDEYLTKKDRQ